MKLASLIISVQAISTAVAVRPSITRFATRFAINGTVTATSAGVASATGATRMYDIVSQLPDGQIVSPADPEALEKQAKIEAWLRAYGPVFRGIGPAVADPVVTTIDEFPTTAPVSGPELLSDAQHAALARLWKLLGSDSRLGFTNSEARRILRYVNRIGFGVETALAGTDKVPLDPTPVPLIPSVNPRRAVPKDPQVARIQKDEPTRMGCPTSAFRA